MNAVEEIKKSLYESYKWLYTEAIDSIKRYLALSKKYREQDKIGQSANWLAKANDCYKRAISYKNSMGVYGN